MECFDYLWENGGWGVGTEQEDKREMVEKDAGWVLGYTVDVVMK
jgi:hypothetical protein